MPYYEDKIYRYFKNEIENSANENIKELQEEIDSIKSKQLKIIDEEIKESVFKAMDIELDELNLDFSTNINRAKLYAHKEVIKKRRDLIDSVLLEVQKKCINFIKTKGYINRMQILVKKIDQEFCEEEIIFEIKKNDSVIKKIITDNFTNKFKIKEIDEIRIGGFIAICLKKGILTDQTIDYKLEEKRKEFHQNMKFLIKE